MAGSCSACLPLLSAGLPVCASESELNAAAALLTLWSKLLSFTSRWWQAFTALSWSPASVSPSAAAASPLRMKDLRLVFELMDQLIGRHEFDLVHLASSASALAASALSAASTFSSSPSRVYRTQSTAAGYRGDARAFPQYRERGGGGAGHSADRLHGHRGGGTAGSEGGSSSSTVPSSSSSFHHTSRSPLHPSFLSHGEQLHLLQSYRQLLQQTVVLLLRMLRESSEGRSHIAAAQLSSHSSSASLHSAAGASSAASADAAAAAGGAKDDSGLELLNDAMLMDDGQQSFSLSGSLLQQDDGSASAAEKEAELERVKVGQMKPELTVTVPAHSSLVNPLLPPQPLSPLSVTSPFSPLSPGAGSGVPSPSSSARSLSSLAASSSSSSPSLLSRADYVWFAGRLLAIVFFRLPVLSGALLDSLSSDAAVDGGRRRGRGQAGGGSGGSSRRQSEEGEDEGGRGRQDDWRVALRARVDEWGRQHASAAGVRKSPSVSALAALLSAPSSSSAAAASTTVYADDSELALSRSITLPLSSAAAAASASAFALSAASSSSSSSSAFSRSASRSLTSAFLHANPSFFEWTKPELNRDTYSDSEERERDREREPPLPLSAAASGSDEDESTQLLSAANLSCLRLLLSHDCVFFVFASAWMSHVQHTANPVLPPLPSPLPPFISQHKQELQHSAASSLYAEAAGAGAGDGILWDLIPGYRLLLQTVLRRLIAQPVTVDEDEDEADIDPADVPAHSARWWTRRC